jgi:hypothetical protein
MNVVVNANSVNQLSRQLGSSSLEKVTYKSTVRHVCCSGGNRLEMRTLDMIQFDSRTKYALCPHCNRMFYAEIGRAIAHKRFDARQPQYA